MGKPAQYLSIVDASGRHIPKKVIASSAAYEGAASGRRMSTWGMSTAGPSASIYSSLNSLRARSRELTRNDPLIDGGLDTLVSNIVGSGISPRWLIDDVELKRIIQALWSDWVPESDFDERSDFYGQEALACRSIIEAGEVFVRLRPRRYSDGLSVPLQIQVLEPDFVDETYNTIAPNGNEIRFGIEINKEGKRVAYWMFREHPGEAFLTSLYQYERVRVPASQVLHIFKPLRPGQMRGRPWMASLIVLMHELNQFDDAELVRKKTAALFGGFLVKPPDEEDDAPSPLGPRGDDDEDGNAVIDLQPGTFPELPIGYDVRFSEPADVGGNYEAFTKRQERRAARGFGGMTYEKFTGNLEGVNYSSIRAGNLEFQRQCKQFIYQVMAHQFCRPIVSPWLEQAVLSGALNLSDYLKNRRKYTRVRWTIDGWPWVDPEKDLKAAKGLIRSGMSTRTIENAERGYDSEDIDAENASDNQRADQYGLVYDSDGRQTDGTGKAKDNGNNKEPDTNS